MKRLAKYTIVALATLAILFLLWQFLEVLLLFLVSLFIAAAARPYINWLVERGLSVGIAQTLLYAVTLGLVVIGIYFLSTIFIDELQMLSNVLSIRYEALYVIWAEGTGWQQFVAEQFFPPEQLYDYLAGTQGELFIYSVLGVAQTAVGLMVSLLLVLAMSIYWSQDQDRFERLWLSLLAPRQRAWARTSWRLIEEALGSYIRSEMIQAFLAIMLLGMGYRVLGVDFPLLLALLGGLAWLVPLVGAVLIALPVLIVGVLNSWAVAITAVLYTLIVLVFLEFVIEPRLFKRRQYSPILIVLTMIPLVDVLGLVGFVLAPPIAVTIQLVWRQLFYLERQGLEKETAVRLDQLEQRYQEVYQIFTNAEGDTYPPEIASILNRLDKLIAQAQTLTR